MKRDGRDASSARTVSNRERPRRGLALTAGSPALDDLVSQTLRLYHRLSSLSSQIHGDGSTSSGRRSLLLELERSGPRTVSEMANERLLSRQYIQTLVNHLEKDGYVELVENPRHKRSRLVRLTPAGRRRLRSIARREAALIGSEPLDVPERELARAARTLSRVRSYFEALADAATTGAGPKRPRSR